jgi:hypothetical protein
MAVGVAPATGAAILNAYFNATNITAPTAIWVQLHTGDPGSAGTSNVATNTTRKDITAVFSAASGATVTSDTLVSWTSVAGSEDYTHWSMWSASSNGTFYWSGTVTANAVTAGDTFNVGVGDIDVALSSAA